MPDLLQVRLGEPFSVAGVGLQDFEELASRVSDPLDLFSLQSKRFRDDRI